ncbi:MAG TPA: YncE family protein, partial [Bryobacteraceae bacterium]|nr:YncE family protein [Bryobacteraceae bacterium]
MRLAFLLLLAGTAMAADLVLIVHKRADSVGIYDDATGASVATIPVGVKPHEMALTADRKFLFVTNYGLDSYSSNDAGGNTISVVDIAARKVTATIDLGRYRRPHGIERGTSGRLYVSTEMPAALHIIDPAERKVIRSIDTPGKLPHMIAVSEDETRAYLANAGSGTVTVVDLKSGGTAQTKVGGVPMGLALSSDGYRLYVTTRGANLIALISTDMMNVVHRIELKGQPARAHLVN